MGKSGKKAEPGRMLPTRHTPDQCPEPPDGLVCGEVGLARHHGRAQRDPQELSPEFWGDCSSSTLRTNRQEEQLDDMEDHLTAGHKQNLEATQPEQPEMLGKSPNPKHLLSSIEPSGPLFLPLTTLPSVSPTTSTPEALLAARREAAPGFAQRDARLLVPWMRCWKLRRSYRSGGRGERGCREAYGRSVGQRGM